MSSAPLVVDLFCGGGGAAEGIRQALGTGPAVAVDFDAAVLAVHEANHSAARHICGDVWGVDPREVTQGQPVRLLWLSPSCTQFSRGNAGKPRDKQIMNLGWVGVKWAAEVKPEVIALENVPAFVDWGPLLPNGLPDPARKGQSFKRWVARLRELGYSVAWRELDAADFGAATHRRRLFVIARRDGQPVTWPAPTHGEGSLTPHVGIKTYLDLTQKGEPVDARSRPLSDRTRRKISAALMKAEPVKGGMIAAIMPYQCGNRGGRGVSKPLYTLMTTASEALIQQSQGGTTYHRMLTLQEVASAQGFPHTYRWPGTKTNSLHVIGNSVSPVAARAIIAMAVLGVTPWVAKYLHVARITSRGTRHLHLLGAAEKATTDGDRREIKAVIIPDVEQALAAVCPDGWSRS